MQDCRQIDASLPIRQGDVLKTISKENGLDLRVVVTADCDIANLKFGDAGLACVKLIPIKDYILMDHAPSHAKRQISRRWEKLAEWINGRWQKLSADNKSITLDRVRTWVHDAPIEEVEAALDLPNDGKPSHLRKEVEAIKNACAALEVTSAFSGLDALIVLQAKQVSRLDQAKTLTSNIDPKDLPLDIFFVSSVPGESGVGFIAKLRSLSFVQLDRTFTSIGEAKEHDLAYLRVGRLEPTFRHALAQQFGMLFARIGLPSDYEADRQLAFELVVDEIGENTGENDD